MQPIPFELTLDELREISTLYPNIEKNSHVGHWAVYIVRKYYLSLDSNATFTNGKNGADIEVNYLGKTESFEIKGTNDKGLGWGKLKVSSLPCYNALVNGMKIIRVSNIGNPNVTLHFLEYNKDFTLEVEARWTIKPVIKAKAGRPKTHIKLIL
ncbi:hypothetical protein DR864_09135 [Runella rosea]|uniref:Protein NO VEIN C-terminal domain-containing protein n=1 Tax=Runella rosea TaxID=2259595 RepID=A0A344TGW2_9BACT|nr:hypothetical protein [Runella rosea]AXE17883.1 hypothetical protein DR864_09135 [Runella rosea]